MGLTKSQMDTFVAALNNTRGRHFGVGFRPRRKGASFRMMNAQLPGGSSVPTRRRKEDAKHQVITVIDRNRTRRRNSSGTQFRRIPLDGIAYFKCGNIVIDLR